MVAAVDHSLLDRVRTRLAQQGAEPTPNRVAEAVRSEGGLIGDAAVLELVDALRRETLGAGPLDELLSMPGVTDILVNGPGLVFVDTGSGLRRVGVRFADDASVRRLAQRLAASAGRRLDDAAPFVDVRLRDGTRLHAVLAPIARTGTCLSLRVPARQPFTLSDLVGRGTLDRTGAELLGEIVRSRVAFVVSGGTGSGKTTLLAALLGLVGGEERLVVVEDAAELSPDHPHVVALEAREPNVEGAGRVSMRDLVRQALRMRPDRLVVGEVRGAEVVDMLAAMNTGHEGGCSTVHANATADVPARFEALAVAAGMSREAVHAQMAAALEAVVHLRQDRDGQRRLAEIGVARRGTSGLVEVVPAVGFPRGGDPVLGSGAEELEQLLAGRARR